MDAKRLKTGGAPPAAAPPPTELPDEMLWEINKKLPFGKRSAMARASPKMAQLWRAESQTHREALEAIAAGLRKPSASAATFDAILYRLKHAPFANRRLKGVPLDGVDLVDRLRYIVNRKLSHIKGNQAKADLVLDVIDAVLFPDVQDNAPVPVNTDLGVMDIWSLKKNFSRKYLTDDGHYVRFSVTLQSAPNRIFILNCYLNKDGPDITLPGAQMWITIPAHATEELVPDLQRFIATVKHRLESATIDGPYNTEMLLVYLLKISGLFHSSAGRPYVSGGFADLCSV